MAQGVIAGATFSYSEQHLACPRSGPAGTEYVNVILDIDELKVDSDEDDPGGDYEFRFYSEASVYARSLKAGESLTPDKKICGTLLGQWYREYDIPDLVKGQYFTFPFRTRVVLHDVPKQSEVLFRLKLDEIDDWTGTDYGALDPTTGQHALYLVAYPFADFTMIGKDAPRVHPDGIPFGTRMTVLGKGEDFWAGVTFTMHVQEPVQVGGAVRNPAVEQTCRSYALQAVEHNLINQIAGCGWGAPVWSSDHQAHFDWCMVGANHQGASAANVQRQTDLTACLAKATPEQQCRAYAKRSVFQFNEATALGCGYAPPVWSPDENAHLLWCLAVGPGVALPETGKRAQALASCRAAKGG